MPLPSPNLDDRSFDQLVNAALERVRRSAPGWTDLSPGDPGVTLLEVFAFLADTTIYRLNQVPDKLYVEFLRLIGVSLQPPSAATVELVVSRDRESDDTIEMAQGTRVTTKGPSLGSELPVFATIAPVRLGPGESQAPVRAIHAEAVAGELLGRSTGTPGQWFSVAHAPIIASSGDPLDLVIGVEAMDEELRGTQPAIEYEGRPYRIWREVDDFADVGTDAEVYVVDRAAGIITLAPAVRLSAAGGELAATAEALAAVPPSERHVRAWYRYGGGSAGNVLSHTLVVLRDQVQGISVTNPNPATGGRAIESLEHAKLRGPQELRSLSRAVTARDFQLVAERSTGAVARAHAYTQRALWRWASPGTVELVIVPAAGDETAAGSLAAAQLEDLQTDEAVQRVERAVDGRRPLGTECHVKWARYKTVRVHADIVVQREQDADAVRRRVDERLHRSISPLPTDESVGGWAFGQSLYASQVYRIILAEPGVRHARGVRLLIDVVPDREIAALVADPHQPWTWYAGSAATLFRSVNDGTGWEPMGRFGAGAVSAIEPNPDVPGLLAVATVADDGAGSEVHVSRDSGETWTFSRPFGFRVEDLAWVSREGEPVLLMATGPSGSGGSGGGLYQLAITAGADAVQVLVDAGAQDRAFYAVTAFREVRGDVAVAVAAQGRAGVYLSRQAGHGDTFELSGLEGEDIRVLGIQADGPRAFLWAGAAAPGGDQVGDGCFRRELLGAEDPVGGWQHFGQGWVAGSCWALGFDGSVVVAGTQQFGVMRLDTNQAEPVWTDPTADVDNGLPLRDLNRFLPVHAVAVDPATRRILAGGPDGIFRTVGSERRGADDPPRFERCSASEQHEEITLPPTWLFVCGDNELTVRSDATS